MPDGQSEDELRQKYGPLWRSFIRPTPEELQAEEDFVSGKVNFWDKGYSGGRPCALCDRETQRLVLFPVTRKDLAAAMTAAYVADQKLEIQTAEVEFSGAR